MASPSASITKDRTPCETIKIARGHKIRHMTAVDCEGKLKSILTQSNIVEANYNNAAGF
jgi:predicted transcriptional regulator